MTDKPSTPIERLRARVEFARAHHKDCLERGGCELIRFAEDLLTLAEALHEIHSISTHVDDVTPSGKHIPECCRACMSIVALAKVGGSDEG